MSTDWSDRDLPSRFEVLKNVIEAAALVVAEMKADPLLKRFLDIYFQMPAEDRETVVTAIERDVKARLLSRATERITGQAARPNPNARLYVRTHGREAQRSDLERDEMMLATMRAMRVMHVIDATPEIYSAWRDATREAIGHVDGATRLLLGRLLGEVLAMVNEHESEMPGESPAAEQEQSHRG